MRIAHIDSNVSTPLCSVSLSSGRTIGHHPTPQTPKRFSLNEMSEQFLENRKVQLRNELFARSTNWIRMWDKIIDFYILPVSTHEATVTTSL